MRRVDVPGSGHGDDDLVREAAVLEDDDPVGEQERLLDVVGVTSSTDGRCSAQRRATSAWARRRVARRSTRTARRGAGAGGRGRARGRGRHAGPPHRRGSPARHRPGRRAPPRRVPRGRGAADRPARRSPSATLAATRFQGSNRCSWYTTARRSGTLMSPVASRSSPATTRSSVVFPEPLAPSRPTSSPGAMSRSRPRRTRRSPKRRDTPRRRTAGSAVGLICPGSCPATRGCGARRDGSGGRRRDRTRHRRAGRRT